jgi:hypothetical protein
VVLIIGDLEETHFNEATERGEINESVNSLERSFKPAIESGKMVVHVHRFSQSDVEEFAGDLGRKTLVGS